MASSNIRIPWRTVAVILAAGLVAWLVYRYRQPRFVAGEPAADFQVTLASGREARLSDLRGRYVLLQFWGSWCGPCRAENPHLVELYRQYHDRGFDIFSIALESGHPAGWQRAIAHDGLEWPYHAVELEEFGGPVARLYNIRSIPATFLLNPDGRIMGVNLAPDQIGRVLEQQLASH
jgi:thiol-disulfide isomerase/thioredoxin